MEEPEEQKEISSAIFEIVEVGYDQIVKNVDGNEVVNDVDEMHGS